MDQESVFQKTARGFLEVSGNKRTLPSNMLALLKEIDGQRSVKELQSKVGSIYTAARTLQVLKGFVEDNLIRELEGAEKPEPAREAPKKAPARAAEPEKPVQPPQQTTADAASANPPAPARAPSAAEPGTQDAALAKGHALAAAESNERAQKEAAVRARARAEAKVKAVLEAEARAKREAEKRTGVDDDLDFTRTA